MSTLSTIATANAPIVWANKAGTKYSAHTATAQVFAPRGARLTEAQARDLAALANGQYRPFLQDVANTLTKSDVKALTRFGYDLAATNKAQAVRLLSAVASLWAGSKGKKAALCATMGQWLATQEGYAAIAVVAPEAAEDTPLPTVPDMGAPVALVETETALPELV